MIPPGRARALRTTLRANRLVPIFRRIDEEDFAAFSAPNLAADRILRHVESEPAARTTNRHVHGSPRAMQRCSNLALTAFHLTVTRQDARFKKENVTALVGNVPTDRL